MVSRLRVRVSSVISWSYRLSTHIFNLRSPAMALMKEVLPVPGGPKSKYPLL